MPPIDRFDPQFMSETDLEDLASFTGLGRDACLERVRDYSLPELA
jgi:hypothetical protein